MKNKNTLTRSLSAFLMTINCLVVLTIIWSCYRSLDWSDESFYYLGYTFFDNPNLSGASFHMIFNNFFSIFELSLPGVRLIRLVLTIVASAILYIGFEKFTGNKKITDKLIFFNVVLSGMLLSYTWAPLALSYNSMSSILMGLITGCWLLSINANNIFYKVAYSFTLGGLFVFLFFVKITNILLFPVIVISTIYVLSRRKSLNRNTIKFTFIYTTSFVVGVLLSLQRVSLGAGKIIPTLKNYVATTLGILDDNTGHSIEAIFKKYLWNSEVLLNKLMYPLILIFSLFLILKFNLFKFKKETVLKFSNLYKYFNVLILIVITELEYYWKGGQDSEYQVLNCYIFIWFGALLSRYLDNKKVNVILFLGLLSVPFAGSLGTNNGLSAQFLFYGAFVFVGIYLLVYSSKNMFYKYSIISLIILLCASQVITASVFYPYRQPALTNCNNKLEGIKFLKGLKVDNSTYKLRKELAFLEKNKAKYVFAYNRHRGMVLLINKIPFSLSWFDAELTPSMYSAINESKIDPRDVIFLLPKNSPLQVEVLACLKNNGIDFKQKYIVVKQVKYFDFELKKEVTLNVYIPRSN
ncbi:MAG: hypothetical protein ACJAZ2_002451 [Glaciecola sp.]|jgi:hypothetical protein